MTPRASLARRGARGLLALPPEPGTRIEWTDGILGDLSIDAASVSDPVLIRADGQVLYTFASVVDDMDMGVTHIVRGATTM
jgi:glutamyl/glutaminyl-tRNA synthetase